MVFSRFANHRVDVSLGATVGVGVLADMAAYQVAILGLHAFVGWNKNPAIQYFMVRLNKVTFTAYDVGAEKLIQVAADDFFNDRLLLTFTSGFYPECNLVAWQHLFHLIRRQEELLFVVGINKAKAASGGSYPALMTGGAVMNLFFKGFKLGKGVFIKHPLRNQVAVRKPPSVRKKPFLGQLNGCRSVCLKSYRYGETRRFGRLTKSYSVFSCL